MLHSSCPAICAQTHAVPRVLQPCFAAPTLRAFREAAGADYPSFHVIAVDEAQFFPGAC